MPSDSSPTHGQDQESGDPRRRRRQQAAIDVMKKAWRRLVAGMTLAYFYRAAVPLAVLGYPGAAFRNGSLSRNRIVGSEMSGKAQQVERRQ
jgi:hypothetical protein